MARGRFLNKKISASKKIQALPDDTCRLMATWIISHLDVQGVFHGEPALVRSYVFPWREDLSNAQIDAYLNAMASVGLITFFETGSTRYQWWPDFQNEQPNLRTDREAAQFPPPPPDSQADDGQMPDSIPADDCGKPGKGIVSDLIVPEKVSDQKGSSAPSEQISAQPSPKEGASQPPQPLRTITQDGIRNPDPALLAAWAAILPEIEMQMQRATYDDYVRPIRPVCIRDRCALFVTEYPNAADWCNGQLKLPIQRTLAHAIEGVDDFSVAVRPQPGGT